MDKFISNFEQRRWVHDVNSYYRWKDLRDICTNEFTKKACQDHMDKIKALYPNHKRVFED